MRVRSIDWHPDLGAERTRPGDLGVWAPLIDPQQVEPGERGTQIFGPFASDLPRGNDRSALVVVSASRLLRCRAGATTLCAGAETREDVRSAGSDRDGDRVLERRG